MEQSERYRNMDREELEALARERGVLTTSGRSREELIDLLEGRADKQGGSRRIDPGFPGRVGDREGAPKPAPAHSKLPGQN